MPLRDYRCEECGWALVDELIFGRPPEEIECEVVGCEGRAVLLPSAIGLVDVIEHYRWRADKLQAAVNKEIAIEERARRGR